jgi:hypothetical protein
MDGGRTTHHDRGRHRFIDLKAFPKTQKKPGTSRVFYTADYNLEVVGELCTIMSRCIDITDDKQRRACVTATKHDVIFCSSNDSLNL